MAENDATQPDAQEHEIAQGFQDESQEAQDEFQESPESEEVELSPRERAMEELVAKRNEEYLEESGEEISAEENVETKVVEDRSGRVTII